MSNRVKTSIASSFFALAAVVICPSPVPAQTPVPAAHPERVKPAPQPAPQSESDKAKAEEKARQEERIKREREGAQAKERAEKARTGTTPPPKSVPVTGVKVGPALTEEQRETMKKAAHFEHVHRTRTARMNRLIRIYKAKGDTAKVQKLEEMKAKEAKRTENAMAGYRKELGEEHWGRLKSEMKRQHERSERGEHEKDKAPRKTDGAR